jgi:hypothetical protein
MKPEDRNAFYSVFYRLLAEILAARLRSTSEELARVKKEFQAAREGRQDGAPAA